MQIRVVAWGSLAVLIAVGIASSAAAGPTPYPYGNFNGTNFDFLTTGEVVQVENNVTLGTLNAQFQAPIVSGNQLIFAPTSFEATASNAVGGIITTHSTLSSTITSNAPSSVFIKQIDISEGGDILLSAFPPGGGTAATGVLASLSGTVTILSALNVSYVGQIINFGGLATPFPSTFTPGPDVGQLFLGLQPAGTFGWTGNVLIDIESLFPGVTSVQLVYNNILQANSETGTSALIQKKAINGPVITVVPEPGTALLLFGGLLVLAISGARNRRS